MTIAIIDYGLGNLGSIKNMLKKLGANSNITSDSNLIENAEKIILPGVGSFDSGMSHLLDSGLKDVLDYVVMENCVPTAGICLGMQLMTEKSEEGKQTGLGWLSGTTVRFVPGEGEKMNIPHMGWNSVSKAKQSNITDGLEDEARFYFVHSYHVKCSNDNDILLTSQYGSVKFVSAFNYKNIIGFQFHPEKSHKYGMQILKAFINWS
jgi:glutamine amidotransferase